MATENAFDLNEFQQRILALYLKWEKPSVAIFHAPWGSGKTRFIKQFIEDSKEQVSSIYIDAFSMDYLDSAFDAVITELHRKLIEVGTAEKTSGKTFLDAAKTVSKIIGSVGAKAAVRFSTAGVISLSDFEGLDGSLSPVEEEADRLIDKAFASRVQHSSAFTSLKESLKSLPNLLKCADTDRTNPVLIIIDELDRCRPDFALGMIETIKHFFYVEGLHFILVSEFSALEAAVASRYGTKINGSEYLEKFYDFYIDFKIPYDSNGSAQLKAFIGNKLFIPGAGPQYKHDLINEISFYAISFEYSLRKLERIMTNVSIGLLATRDHEFKPHFLLVFLCVVKSADRDLYAKLRAMTARPEDIDKFFEKSKPVRNMDHKKIETFLKVLLMTEAEIHNSRQQFQNYLESIEQMTSRIYIGRTQIMKYMIENIVERFGGSITVDTGMT